MPGSRRPSAPRRWSARRAGRSRTGPRPRRGAPAKAAAAAAAECSAAYTHRAETLHGGTTWRMCWRYESKAGLVLDNVSYQPKGEARPIKVLNSRAKLAQIHVPYDDGKTEYDDITGQGFAQGLSTDTRPNAPAAPSRPCKVPGRLGPRAPRTSRACAPPPGPAATPTACRATREKVYQAQGKDLLVYTVNQVGWYEYITEWRSQDDGTIHERRRHRQPLARWTTTRATAAAGPSARAPRTTPPATPTTSSGGSTSASTAPPRTKVEQYDSKVSPPAAAAAGPDQQDHPHPGHQGTRGRRQEHALVARGQRDRQEQGRPRRASYEIVPGAQHQVPGPQLHQARRLLHRVQQVRAVRQQQPGQLRCRRRQDRRQMGQRPDPHPPRGLGERRASTTSPGTRTSSPCRSTGRASRIAPRDVTAMNPLTPAALAGQNGHVDKR